MKHKRLLASVLVVVALAGVIPIPALADTPVAAPTSTLWAGDGEFRYSYVRYTATNNNAFSSSDDAASAINNKLDKSTMGEVIVKVSGTPSEYAAKYHDTYAKGNIAGTGTGKFTGINNLAQRFAIITYFLKSDWMKSQDVTKLSEWDSDEDLKTALIDTYQNAGATAGDTNTTYAKLLDNIMLDMVGVDPGYQSSLSPTVSVDDEKLKALKDGSGLALGTVDIDANAKWRPLYFAAQSSAQYLLSEAASYMFTWRKSIMPADVDTEETDDSTKNTLIRLYIIEEVFGDTYPFLRRWWENKDNTKYSCKELYEAWCKGEPPSDETIELAQVPTIDMSYTEGTALGRFYSPSVADQIPIVSYDLEEVVSGTGAAGGNGHATSFADVTLNDNILQGMIYSATYMPLKTNVYSPDVIEHYKAQSEDGEDWLNSFFYRYGFFRKALYKSDSGQSVMDFYNAGGRQTGTTSLATLRDIVYNNGDDITLYVDTGFYNAEKSLSEVTPILEARVKKIRGLGIEFTAIHELYTTLKELKDEYNKYQSWWDSFFNNEEKLTEYKIKRQEALTNAYYSLVKSTVNSKVFVLEDIQEFLQEKFNPDSDPSYDLTWEHLNADFSINDKLIEYYDYDLESALSSYNVPLFQFFGSKRPTTQDILSYCKQAGDTFLSVAEDYEDSPFNERTIKTREYSDYSSTTKEHVDETKGAAVSNEILEMTTGQHLEYDNIDCFVLSSYQINEILEQESHSILTQYDYEEEARIDTIIDKIEVYTPKFGAAYVSALYRDNDRFEIANMLQTNNPVFMSSDDMPAISNAGQWYKNTLLNYMLVRNLKSAAQIDYNYVIDLDCPVYIDIFGNILSESGLVVIPAASNATLHTADYYQENFAAPLYALYGKDYYVPTSLVGADQVLNPFFVMDESTGYWITNGNKFTVNGQYVKYDTISAYDSSVQAAVMETYKGTLKGLLSVSSSVTAAPDGLAKLKLSSDGQSIVATKDGAPIKNLAGEDIASLPVSEADKIYSGIYYPNGAPTMSDIQRTGGIGINKATKCNWPALVHTINEVMRGAPLENIDKVQENIDTAYGNNKSAIVAAVKLEALDDNLNGDIANSLITLPDFTRMEHIEYWIALMIKFIFLGTVIVICLEVYRDTTAQTLGLHTLYKSLMSILLTVAAVVLLPSLFQLSYYTANKFLLQDECERILMYNLERYQGGAEIRMTESRTAPKVDDFALQLDWVEIPWYEEFNEVVFGESFRNVSKVRDEAINESRISLQPDVTIYNDGIYTTCTQLFESVNIDYTFPDSTQSDASAAGMYLWATNDKQTASFFSPYYAFLKVLVGQVNSYNYYNQEYNYTTKYISGNRMKTVGLCQSYFTSKSFMEKTQDVMHLYEIYNDPKEHQLNRVRLFSYSDIDRMSVSNWYNNMHPEDLDKRVDLMNKAARDFIAKHRDMLDKVTDETFLKVMALHMAIKHNEYFSVSTANALEIYNIDSTDLIRLSIVSTEDAVYAAPMSFARYVYNFGGEPSVYAASVLEAVMWIGSYIKPLCTIIVFLSVFFSLWVFRVVLKRPSANIFGYIVTISLLCLTNFLHAILLKVSIYLPDWGFPTLVCILFLIIFQVAYLMVLGYVTGVALSDWQNLGATTYEREGSIIKERFNRFRGRHFNHEADMLSGNIKHHDDNWQYYNDLVDQHRSRNAT